jgi:hypothetical protein
VYVKDKEHGRKRGEREHERRVKIDEHKGKENTREG